VLSSSTVLTGPRLVVFGFVKPVSLCKVDLFPLHVNSYTLHVLSVARLHDILLSSSYLSCWVFL
jgi:hypothetical protein